MAEIDKNELQWRRLFAEAYADHFGKDSLFPPPEIDLPIEQWLQEAFLRVQSQEEDSALYEILTTCSCTFPEKELEFFRTLYRKTRNIDMVHQAMQEWFTTMIRSKKNLNQEHLQYMRTEGMGMAGKLNEFRITAVKIPKDFTDWFEEKDSEKRKRLYCHCPRVRDAFSRGTESEVPPSYCLCGAGFYKHLWSFILEKPVTVSVEESLLTGADHCRIAIALPGKSA